MNPTPRIRPGRREGFTLVELLLVVAIIGILVAIALPKFTGRTKEARITAARADIEAISTAIRLYELDLGDFPASLADLLAGPAGSTKWRGPYLEKGMPMDPWDRGYVYVCPGAHHPNGFDLQSLGPDGVESDDDIVNWSASAVPKTE
jgi:general secretion pathway protein G